MMMLSNFPFLKPRAGYVLPTGIARLSTNSYYGVVERALLQRLLYSSVRPRIDGEAYVTSIFSSSTEAVASSLSTCRRTVVYSESERDTKWTDQRKAPNPRR